MCVCSSIMRHIIKQPFFFFRVNVLWMVHMKYSRFFHQPTHTLCTLFYKWKERSTTATTTTTINVYTHTRTIPQNANERAYSKQLAKQPSNQQHYQQYNTTFACIQQYHARNSSTGYATVCTQYQFHHIGSAFSIASAFEPDTWIFVKVVRARAVLFLSHGAFILQKKICCYCCYILLCELKQYSHTART